MFCTCAVMMLTETIVLQLSDEVLPALNEKLVVTDSYNPHDGVMDINRLAVEPDLVIWVHARKHHPKLRRVLVGRLRKNASDVGAYALLNTIYPEFRLTVATGVFHLKQPVRPILFQYDGHYAPIEVTRKTYQEIACEYWDVMLLSDKTDLRRLFNLRYPVKSRPDSMKSIVEQIDQYMKDGTLPEQWLGRSRQ